MARRKDGEVRAGILKTATQLFGERGLRATTVKSIADRLGIAPGTLYVYFPSKEELFRQAVAEGWALFLGQIRNIASAPALLRERFDTTLDYCFTTLRSALPLLQGMLFEARQRDLLQQNLNRLVELLEGLILELLRQARTEAQPDRHFLREQLRLTVFGVLAAVALAPDEELEAEIARIKAMIDRILRERLRLGASE